MSSGLRFSLVWLKPDYGANSVCQFLSKVLGIRPNDVVLLTCIEVDLADVVCSTRPNNR